MMDLLLLILFIALFIAMIANSIVYIKKHDQKLLFVNAVLILIVILWGFSFDEKIKLRAYLMWLICFSILSIVIISIYLYVSKKRRGAFVTAIICGAYWLFTFCSDGGSVRLAIALMGYPNVAYSTNLIENTYMRQKNISYYISEQLIETENGTLNFFECRKYGILKISNYDEGSK